MNPNAARWNDAPFEARSEDEWLCGPWRAPTNNSSHEAGTIHDGATAQALGFAGGTVAGSIHMEQFPPLLEAAFGTDWHHRGNLSVYFTRASIDAEPVQAMVGHSEQRDQSCTRRAVTMQTQSGELVLEGTAALGLDEHSAVRMRLARSRRGLPPRMLAGVDPGFAAYGLRTCIDQGSVTSRLSALTERSIELTDPARFGGHVAPLSAAVHAMRVFEDRLPLSNKRSFVGLFGAIDWQYIDGPVLTDRPYLVDGVVLAIGDSPQTEMLWYECTLRTEDAQPVARMVLLSRLLKRSSPLWAEP